MLAAALQAPEIAITTDEAAAVADAVAKVARHYDAGLSDKAADWGNLALVAGAVYGPRILAYRYRSSAKPTE